MYALKVRENKKNLRYKFQILAENEFLKDSLYKSCKHSTNYRHGLDPVENPNEYNKIITSGEQFSIYKQALNANILVSNPNLLKTRYYQLIDTDVSLDEDSNLELKTFLVGGSDQKTARVDPYLGIEDEKSCFFFKKANPFR
jgi:hypothetical protein